MEKLIFIKFDYYVKQQFHHFVKLCYTDLHIYKEHQASSMPEAIPVIIHKAIKSNLEAATDMRTQCP